MVDEYQLGISVEILAIYLACACGASSTIASSAAEKAAAPMRVRAADSMGLAGKLSKY